MFLSGFIAVHKAQTILPQDRAIFNPSVETATKYY